MRAINRRTLLCVAGLVALVSGGYLIGFRASGSGGRSQLSSAERVRLTPMELPDGFKSGVFTFGFAGSNVWALGYNGHDPKLGLESTDNGATWVEVALPTSGFILRAISFPDPQNGWAVGDYGTIVRTSDGGKTLERLKRPTEKDLTCVDFVNDKVGYVGGRLRGFDRATNRMVYGAVVLKTTDRGQSWTTCYEDDHSDGVVVEALTESYVLVSADHDLISEDGGITWGTIDSQGRLPSSFTFTEDGIGHGVQLGGEGGFFESNDRGKTWQKLTGLPESLLSHKWWSMDFADVNHGIVVGEKGALAVTRDGGRTWTEVQTGIKEDLLDVKLRGSIGFVRTNSTSPGVYRLVGF